MFSSVRGASSPMLLGATRSQLPLRALRGQGMSFSAQRLPTSAPTQAVPRPGPISLSMVPISKVFRRVGPSEFAARAFVLLALLGLVELNDQLGPFDSEQERALKKFRRAAHEGPEAPEQRQKILREVALRGDLETLDCIRKDYYTCIPDRPHFPLGEWLSLCGDVLASPQLTDAERIRVLSYIVTVLERLPGRYTSQLIALDRPELTDWYHTLPQSGLCPSQR